MQLLSGAFDYNTVIKRAVAEMTNSGLRTVDYATGYSNRVDVAARRAVLTGFNQVTAKVNEDNAKKLGTGMFEVSRHGGHRPEHWWGGRWYTYKQLQTVCGLGRVDGLCGANCYHSYSPVIPGISQPTYSADELERLEAEEKVKHTYMGKEYTKYEALQKQRRMETTMRAQRQQIKLLEGTDAEEALGNAKARYFAKSDEYVKFSRAMGLPQQRERITVDGLGKIKRDKTVANSGKSGIIRESERKRITKITDKAISTVPKVTISGLTDDQNLFIQQQHKRLLEFARDKNGSKEVAFIFDEEFKRCYDYLGSDKDLNFGNDLLDKGDNLFVMHNHPRNSTYSDTDVAFFLSNDSVKHFSVVKNNGSIETLSKTAQYDKKALKIDFARQYKRYVKTGSDSEIDKAVRNFLVRNKEMISWNRS